MVNPRSGDCPSIVAVWETLHMAAEHIWETPEDIFDDDPKRVAKLEALASQLRGANARPWPETLDALGAFLKDERDAAAATQPLAGRVAFTCGIRRHTESL